MHAAIAADGEQSELRRIAPPLGRDAVQRAIMLSSRSVDAVSRVGGRYAHFPAQIADRGLGLE